MKHDDIGDIKSTQDGNFDFKKSMLLKILHIFNRVMIQCLNNVMIAYDTTNLIF